LVELNASQIRYMDLRSTCATTLDAAVLRQACTGLVPTAQPTTGDRQIDLAKAAMVNRIFRAYAPGQSPKCIALMVNPRALQTACRRVE